VFRGNVFRLLKSSCRKGRVKSILKEEKGFDAFNLSTVKYDINTYILISDMSEISASWEERIYFLTHLSTQI
jgi:hypothetical protein